MALSDFVQSIISSAPPAVTRPGFGTPLILAADAPAGFTNRVRVYTDPSGLLTDGFSATGGTYLAASRLCQPTIRPTQFKVGRLANKPTQAFRITPVASNSTVYTLNVDGTDVTYTSDSTATIDEITAGLKTAIDALSLTVTTVADVGNHWLTITANVAGAFHSVKSYDVTLLGVLQNHADPGIAADLAAIFLEDSDFYGIQNQFNSRAVVVAAAAWCETNKKLFIPQVQDSVIVTVAGSAAADVMSDIASANYFYTAPIYSEDTRAFADAAWLGAAVPQIPGSEQWGLWTLVGVVASKLNATQQANATATQRRGNVYLANQGGKDVTFPGKVGSGEWIDVVRFKDWLNINLALDVFLAVQAAVQRGAKIPYDDSGLATLQGIIDARLQAGIKAGGLKKSPAPVVAVPLAANISDADKAARTVTGFTWTASLAGAIIAVKPITGYISL